VLISDRENDIDLVNRATNCDERLVDIIFRAARAWSLELVASRLAVLVGLADLKLGPAGCW
jgi:hypothetical protein